MNSVQQGVVSLIRSALTGKSCPLPPDFSLEEAETLAVRHQIVGLVYEGALLCGIPGNQPVMGRLFQRYCQVVRCNDLQMAEVAAVTAAFEQYGVDYLPVKGCVLKALYPKAAMRVMTDADILIRMRQRAKIAEAMKSAGCREGSLVDYEWKWDSSHLCFELHTQLVPRHYAEHFGYEANGWDQAVHASGCRYDLTAEEQYIFLFMHYTKHYRSYGIGLRQIIDLHVYRSANPALDMEYILRRLQQLKLEQFHENTCRLLQNWFADGPADGITEHMTDYIFSCGSWGTHQQKVLAEGSRDASGKHSAGQSRRRAIARGIFPPVRILSGSYPVLNKAPWLLPFLWPVRWVTILLFRRESIRKFREKTTVWTDENITNRRKAMEYVGLR